MQDADGGGPDDADAPSDTTDAGPDLAALERRLDRIEQHLSEVARLGQRHADHVGALHAENQVLRSGEAAGAVLPLLRDVMALHDKVHQLEAAGAPEAKDDLALVRGQVVATLDRWGIRPLVPSVGDPFDAAVHHGVGRVPSLDAPDGTVAAVRRVGFVADDGRVWRPAEVDVHRTPTPPPG